MGASARIPWEICNFKGNDGCAGFSYRCSNENTKASSDVNRGGLYRRSLLCAVVHCAMALSLHAQVYPLKWYRTTDGLSHSMVICMVQDRDGYLWCGTLNGVSRFDGNEFQRFNTPESGLSDKWISSLALDSTGYGVWCSVDYGGVYHIDRYGTVTQLAFEHNGRFAPLENIKFVIMDESRALWIAAADGQLFRHHPRRGWQVFRSPTGFCRGLARPVRYRATKEIWTISGERVITVFNDDGAIRSIDLRDVLPKSAHPERMRIWSLVPNRMTGGLWIVTDMGSISVEGVETAYRLFPANNIAGFIYLTSSTDERGNLWIAQTDSTRLSYSYKKISCSDGKTLLSIGNSYEFAHMLPFGAVYEDREGSVWIGAEGLAHLSSAAMLQYHLSSKSEPVVGRDLFFLKDNRKLLVAWTGVYEFGADPYAIPRAVFLPTPGLLVGDAFQDASGKIHWNSGGYYCYDGTRVVADRKGNRWTWRGKLFPTIFSAAILNDETMAFPPLNRPEQVVFVSSTGDTSSILLREGTADEEEFDEPIWSTHSPKVKADRVIRFSNAAMWEISPERNVHRYGRTEGYRPGQVPRMCEDSAGKIWIGFRRPVDDAALLRFNGKRFVPYTVNQLGLPGSSIVGLCAHPNKRDILILSSNTLSFLDLRTMKVRKILTEKDGMFAFSGAVFVDADSALWIISSGGLTRYDEHLESSRLTPPKVVISSFNAGSVSLQLPTRMDEVTLGYHPDKVEFTYSALTYISKDVEFVTKLEGLDREWSVPTKDRFTRYTNLDPGGYRFRVRAIDDGQGWRSEEAEFRFSIPPPVYRRWWFVLTGAILLFAGLYAFYRYRLAHAVKLERMRSRIALDLHDEISSMLTSISFLSTSARHDIGASDSGAAKKLQKIGETARSVVGMMSDIIWSLKPEHDSFRDLGRRLGDMAIDLCEGTNIEVQLSFPDQIAKVPLRMDRRRQFYLIAKEAVHNAIKHSRCTRIAVSMTNRNGIIELSIADNGEGFDGDARPNAHDGGTGLTSMQRRAGESGATLFLERNASGGTTVRVVSQER